MDRWVNGQMDGLADRQMGHQVDGRWIDRWEGWIDGRTDGCIERQTDGSKDGQMD